MDNWASCIRHYHPDFSLLCLGVVWTKGKLRNTMWVLKLWLEHCMGGKPLSHEPILEHTEHHWAIFIDIFSSNEAWRRRSIGLGGQYLLCVLMCSEHSWHVYEMIWNAYKMHSWCKISIFWHGICGARNDFLELDPINPNGGVDTNQLHSRNLSKSLDWSWVQMSLYSKNIQHFWSWVLSVKNSLFHPYPHFPGLPWKVGQFVSANLWQGWWSNLATMETCWIESGEKSYPPGVISWAIRIAGLQ